MIWMVEGRRMGRNIHCLCCCSMRSKAFLSLLYVRDMSGVSGYKSGYMRRVGRVPAFSSLLSSTYSDALPITSSTHH